MESLSIFRMVIYLNQMFRRLLILPFVLISVSACQTTSSRPPGVSAIEATWLFGIVANSPRIDKKGDQIRYIAYPKVEGSWLADLEENLKPGASAPAVLWLHGCTGQSSSTDNAIRIFQSSGYTVFAPNSLARPRNPLCGSRMRNRITLRHQEIKYALSQIRTFPWVDQERLVLAGFSEGAQATAAWQGQEFIAHVLVGTDCRFNGGSPNAPDGVRILNLVGARDHYGYGSGCSLPGSLQSNGSKVKIYPDLNHAILWSPGVAKDLADFLEALNSQ